MKNVNLKKLSALLTTLFFVMTISCEYNDAVAPDMSEKASSDQNIEFISIYESNSFNKSVPTELKDKKYVSYKDGGELILEYKASDYNNGNVFCKVTLKVFSETISEDAELQLSLNSSALGGNVDVTFQPHGITFAEAALLNIEAKELDLTGIDVKKIALYYDNQETGKWQKMKTKEIIVKRREGYIKIIDGELPHFSRYAVAYGR